MRRYGKFSIPRTWVEDNLCQYVYDGSVIPIRVEHDFACDYFDVTAISEKFAEVKQGCEIPRYVVTMECDRVAVRDITGLVIGGHCENYRAVFELYDPLPLRPGCRD